MMPGQNKRFVFSAAPYKTLHVWQLARITVKSDFPIPSRISSSLFLAVPPEVPPAIHELTASKDAHPLRRRPGIEERAPSRRGLAQRRFGRRFRAPAKEIVGQSSSSGPHSFPHPSNWMFRDPLGTVAGTS
jgi:hypothetical protein